MFDSVLLKRIDLSIESLGNHFLFKGNNKRHHSLPFQPPFYNGGTYGPVQKYHYSCYMGLSLRNPKMQMFETLGSARSKLSGTYLAGMQRSEKRVQSENIDAVFTDRLVEDAYP